MSPILLVHIAGGTLAIIAGYVALSAAKGARVHRRSGTVFVGAMLVMTATGGSVAAVRAQEGSVTGAVLAAYLVVTGLTTVWRPAEATRWLDVVPMLTALAMGAANLALAAEAYATSGGMRDGVPGFMFVLFGTVALLAGAGDLRMIRAGAPKGVPRLRRHLWRMCFALWIATGSFFLGQADELPQALRNPLFLILPAFLPLLAMPYWLWRVGSRRGNLTSRPAESVATPARAASRRDTAPPARAHGW